MTKAHEELLSCARGLADRLGLRVELRQEIGRFVLAVACEPDMRAHAVCAAFVTGRTCITRFDPELDGPAREQIHGSFDRQADVPDRVAIELLLGELDRIAAERPQRRPS